MLCRLLHLSFCHFSFDHCVICPPIYGFWLPLWYLRFTDSDYPFGILDLRILITPLVSFDHCAICPSPIYGFWLPLWYLRFTILITPLVSFDHCVFCPSPIYGLWLPPFGIFWLLCNLSFSDLRILITSLWYLQTFLQPGNRQSSYSTHGCSYL